MLKKTQFIYEPDDHYDFDFNEIEVTKIIVFLLSLEKDRPGTLSHVLRSLGLIADNWIISSCVGDPNRSRQAQEALELCLINAPQADLGNSQ